MYNDVLAELQSCHLRRSLNELFYGLLCIVSCDNPAAAKLLVGLFITGMVLYIEFPYIMGNNPTRLVTIPIPGIVIEALIETWLASF